MKEKPKITKYTIMQPGCCVHCTTFTQAKRFMKWARDNGITSWWNDFDSVLNNKWEEFKEDSCYQFVLNDQIALTNLAASKKHKYQVYEYLEHKWV